MSIREELKSALIHLGSEPREFESLALEIYRYQYAHNPLYRQFAASIKRTPKQVKRLEKIPFLPISFFKSHQITTGFSEPQAIFESSGTTSALTSRHLVKDLALYEILSRKTFETLYAPLSDYHIFALLPSYLERNNSSLVYMVQNFIYHSFSTQSGFFLNNTDEMLDRMLQADDRKILLIGVSFALLDLVEKAGVNEKLAPIRDRLTVMETGGMKGRRKELIREELHAELSRGFGVEHIHSEYGMTELLSQGYSKGEGIFQLPNSMKILLREVNDPFTFLPHFPIGKKPDNIHQRTGGINVLDLANLDSCSFIETQDLGVYTEDYTGFKVVGRFDNSDIRGCNLLLNS
jgi:phenylacetate-coenzyme A ligase PaaK-like adenylate-forming protein